MAGPHLLSLDKGSAETERHHSEMGRMVHRACVSTSLWVGYVTEWGPVYGQGVQLQKQKINLCQTNGYIHLYMATATYKWIYEKLPHK